MKKYYDVTKKAAPILAGAGTVAATALPVMAESSDTMSTVQSALTTSFTSVASSIGDTIGDVLPIVLPLIGVGVLIFAGIRIFKRVSGNI